jgi:hypothetical protein
LDEIEAAKYDALLPGDAGVSKLSSLYKQTKNASATQPTVKLKASAPVAPEAFAVPNYRRLVLMTQTEGEVSEWRLMARQGMHASFRVTNC